MSRVSIISVVVGALGELITKFEKYVKKIGIDMTAKHVQNTTLLGTARNFDIGTWMLNVSHDN